MNYVLEGKERYASPYHMALVAAGLADRDAVVSWLGRAYADRSGWMVFLPVEPEFDGVRQQPEVRRLLERVRPTMSQAGAAAHAVATALPGATAPRVM